MDWESYKSPLQPPRADRSTAANEVGARQQIKRVYYRILYGAVETEKSEGRSIDCLTCRKVLDLQRQCSNDVTCRSLSPQPLRATCTVCYRRYDSLTRVLGVTDSQNSSFEDSPEPFKMCLAIYYLQLSQLVAAGRCLCEAHMPAGFRNELFELLESGLRISWHLSVTAVEIM